MKSIVATRHNIIANYIGAVWTALMGFVFVPFYLRYIGADGYGLVGVFLMLSSIMAIFDGGLGMVASRECAAFAGLPEPGKRDTVALLRTMEAVFWGVAVLAGLAVSLMAHWIVEFWINVPVQRVEETTAGVRLMGIALLFQFPAGFYSGCLNGLQHQVRLNVVVALAATIRGVGALLVLSHVAPTIGAYFGWQALSGAVTALILRFTLWQLTGHTLNQPRFAPAMLKRVGNFAAGVAGINVLSLLLMQSDKIILSKVLSLEQFGYYTLAWALATMIYRVTGPLSTAYFPRLAQFSHSGDKRSLFSTYQNASRVIGMLVAPLCLWIAVFSRPILTLWTQNPSIAEAASLPLSLLSVGTMLHCFMHIPYSMQLALNHTSLAIWQNVIASAALVPLTYFLATHFGLIGAAVPWFILNLACVLVMPYLIHRKLHVPNLMSWYGQAIFWPVLLSGIALAIAYVCYADIPGNRLLSLSVVGVGLGFALLLVLMKEKLPLRRQP